MTGAHLGVVRRLADRDPKSRIGEAIRVVGYSAGMDRVLVVVPVPAGHPPGGASTTPRQGRYRQARGLPWVTRASLASMRIAS
ncbi:MAG: hypothetical protein ACRDRO_02025 [Pseudonocardiaceae bacterium]